MNKTFFIISSIILSLISIFGLFFTGGAAFYIFPILLGVSFGLIAYKKPSKKKILLYSSLIVFFILLLIYILAHSFNPQNLFQTNLLQILDVISIPKFYEILFYPLALNIFQFIKPKNKTQ